MDLDLGGKVALVTGGSRGIGRASALALAQEGCHVAICARGEEGLGRALEELRPVSPRVWGKVADVTSSSDVEAFVAGAVEYLGGIDALICNVGGFSGGRDPGRHRRGVDGHPGRQSDARRAHDTRRRPTQERAWPRKHRYRVVDIGLEAGAPSAVRRSQGRRDIPVLGAGVGPGRRPHPRQYGLPGLHIFPRGGWADYRRDDPEGYVRFMENELPEKRLGTDTEVAEVIAFLCSKRSRWINGAMIPVDGGQSRPSGRWFN